MSLDMASVYSHLCVCSLRLTIYMFRGLTVATIVFSHTACPSLSSAKEDMQVVAGLFGKVLSEIYWW
jgi:hypothetical protein